MINDEESCCPICLIPTTNYVTAPCTHSACQQCFERILLSTSSSRNRNGWDDDYNEEAVEDRITECPTRGRCPFCRRAVNMFDLKNNQSHVYEQDTDLEQTPLNGLEFAAETVSFTFKDGTAEVALYRENANGDKELVR